MKKPILLAAIAFSLGGCRTIDDTASSNGICSVHGDPMTIQELRITPGYEGYVSEYYGLMMERFPNHGSYRFNHTQSTLGARKIRTYVCETCDQEFERYWSEKK